MQTVRWIQGSNNGIALENHNNDEAAEPTELNPMPAPIEDASVTLTIWSRDRVDTLINALIMPRVGVGRYFASVPYNLVPDTGSYPAEIVSVSPTAGRREFEILLVVTPS